MSQTVRFGRYLLGEKIAAGGMAEIYLAKLIGVEGFEKKVVIKKILPQWSSDPEFVKMLINEAKILVGLNHPHIVQVYELGEEKGQFFIAMEYVEGVDLQKLGRWFAGKKEIPPLGLALLIVQDILQALSFAHGEIVHRDLSPHNVLLSRDGLVKLTDFGIAKTVSRDRETLTGVLKGKFSYMSPEQADGKPISSLSDLYSVGIILYELLTGEKLYPGDSDLEVLDRVRRGQIHLSAAAEKGLPTELIQILKKSLSLDPAARFATAQDFSEALGAFQQKVSRVDRKELAQLVRKIREESNNESFRYAETRSIPGSGGISWNWKIGAPIGLAGLALLSLLFFRNQFRSISTGEQQGTVTPGPGYLSLQAIPWGFVTIDKGKRMEAPIHRLALAVGVHQIKVFYEPENRLLSRTLQVQANQHHRCVADFSKSSTLRCEP